MQPNKKGTAIALISIFSGILDLVLFTDGVVEARNTHGEAFGQERLCTLLHAKAHATAV